VPDHPSVPPGDLLYVIGDIHGCADLLTDLLHQIERDAASNGADRKRLIFVGDYVDRGPDSRRVIEILIAQRPASFEASFLKGNHEALLLDFLADAERLRAWRINGGDATMLSYGVDVAGLERTAAPPEDWRAALKDALPQSHAAFFETLALQASVGDYHFVHAGVLPGVPLDAQHEDDLLWIREEFLNYRGAFGKVVVHGHTPCKLPDKRANRIGIDTGAVFTGRLTALKLKGGEQSFLHT
jgi:serine/threonine protein phosphatase 1